MKLEKFSFGMGDRFLHQGVAQLQAIVNASNAGFELTPVWLEELIGLDEGGGEGLAIAKEVYAKSLEHMDALCKPYATVIDIDADQLPSAETVNAWSGEQYARALRHNQADPLYNLHLRQLFHVGYKVAAQMDERYYGALRKFESDVSRNVTENLWVRHIKPLFID